MAHDDHDDAEAFRRLAQQIGFADALRSGDDPRFEDPDELIARLTAQDEGIAPAPKTETDTPASPAASVRHLGRWYAVGGLIAAAVLGFCVVVIPTWTSTPVSAETPPVLDFEFASAAKIAYAPGEPATAALREAAQKAVGLPQPPRPGQDQTVVSDNWFAEIDDSLDSATRIIPQLTRRTLHPDGSMTNVTERGKPLSADGRGLPPSMGPVGPKKSTEQLPAGTVEASFAADLSLDPRKLAVQLLNRADCESRDPGNARSFCLWNEVSKLFQVYELRPALVSSLWTMLSTEADFRSLGTVTDRAGRRGVGISYISDSSPNYRNILIISPETGGLLGEESILIKKTEGIDVETPAIMSFTSYLKK